MTIKVVGEQHMNNMDTSEPRVIKAYDPAELQANVEAEVAEGSQEAQPSTTQTAEGTPEQPKTPAEERAERRAAFKRAADIEARARQMEKAAQEKLQKAQRFEEVANKAKENPVEVAKALGMDPTEFLRQYQNQMFNIPTEPEKPKEEDVQTRLSRYETERQEERKRAQELESQTVRNGYISQKILPNLLANKEKFEILNHNNIEASAGFIYDMMDQHYRATGEELNPLDVAEEMENQLAKELEDRIVQVKKFARFSKYFKEDVQEATVTTTPPTKTLPSNTKSKTLSDSLGSGAPVPTRPPVQRQRIPHLDKQARIERVAQRLAEKEKI